ncbi:ammonium transporter [Breznakia pachnodae]|uniref:Amt family ammonium transporter n=1 Tax=Breznakia pachnodae TaxID=265178 RepID=A0ABU0E350_9FIRM|nr:ammonium transporter [Breznakia pachnodae]MDQ0361322.1 Amt family ammonium transporter [Breznakia pachnodae]
MDGVFSSVDTIWVLLGATLVFFMQAGFAMVESGFTRAKNAGNIIMKNLMDFAIGTIIFWIVGFGLMFGEDIAGFVGSFDFFIQGNYDSTFPTFVFVIFQTVFCATAATIVSGAMAERTKFSAYCLYSLIISAVIYPISGHWIWGGGWLAEAGFHDFAGSTAVHMVGGVAALVGAKILGPRIGKYDKKGKPRAIPGHSLALGALGVFILWFCWFGFNGCSTVSMTGDASLISAGNIFVNTNLAAASATVVAMLVTWFIYKKPDVSMTLNGSLAGLVAITAGCDLVDPFGAAIIGALAGGIMIFAVWFIDHVLKIDDPVGAIAVHGFCGASGTIFVGLFAVEGGLFYGGGTSMLLTQLMGVGAVLIWVVCTMTIVFLVIKKTIGLRVSEHEELVGLDLEEHGLQSAYGGFVFENEYIGGATDVDIPEPAVPLEDAVPVEVHSKKIRDKEKAEGKMTKVVIVTNPERFDALKTAMDRIGVMGMTVTRVLGCGTQRGQIEYYRGAEVDMELLPKLKAEIVVSAVPVELVVETAKKTLYTGNIGDGKIFIYDVENVIKIRTGEEGVDALKNED